MIASNVAALLLASGQSTRFGAADKLMAPLAGKPVVLHAAETILQTRFGFSFAVVAANNHKCAMTLEMAGLTVIKNATPEKGQGASLGLGMREVINTKAAGVLVMLGDMPMVNTDHVRDLCAAIGDADAAVSMVKDGAGRRPMPPVLFARSAFDALYGLKGSQGARRVLDVLPSLVEVPLSSEAAIDIDTPHDLDAHALEKGDGQ